MLAKSFDLFGYPAVGAEYLVGIKPFFPAVGIVTMADTPDYDEVQELISKLQDKLKDMPGKV